VPSKIVCAELDELKRAAALVFREVKRIRRSRDLSFCEDVELNWRKRKSVQAVLKHLLVGHRGHPCPGGTRPIVKSTTDGLGFDLDSMGRLLAAAKSQVRDFCGFGLGDLSELWRYRERRRSTR